MREILFRGKTDGQWVQGSYVCGHKRYGTGEAVHFITGFYGINRVVVDPETLGQFTGLTDRKGKRVFESDIVIIEYSTTKVKGYIEYQGVAFYVATNSDLWDINEFVSIEVIGNIHDNPELLEVKND